MVDCANAILCGRLNGGIAILWNKSLNSSVFHNPDKSIIGIKVTISATEYNSINAYLPYCNSANKDNFLRHLGALEAIYKLLVSPHVILAGDFNAIVESLLVASSGLFSTKRKKSKFKLVPGWNNTLKDAHAAARHAYMKWLNNNSPRCDPSYIDMKETRKAFKYCLKQCKKKKENNYVQT